MSEFIPAMPHGDIVEVFPDIFFVTGTTRPNFEDTVWQFSRNMIIVRDGSALTLINTVRLNEEGLEALDRLGTVGHVVKLGAFHGYDDPFYLDRYGAKQWALPGMQHEGGQATDEELKPGGPTPFSNASVFVFETSAQPEGLIIIEREGGVVVSCDSLQNWVEVDQFFDEATGQQMTQIGFIQPANVGPGWRRYSSPEASDFARLKQVPFKHLLPAHGTPLRGEAHEQFSATFAREFGV